MNFTEKIIEFFVNYLTKENITLAIAVLGFLLSIFNVIQDWNSKRKNLTISIPFVFCNEHNLGYSFLMLEIVNNSNLPITITRLFAKINKKTFELGKERIRMYEYSYPERRGKTAEDTTCIPVSIEPLGYKKLLLSIPETPQLDNLHVSLEIETNRGKVKKALIITKKITEIKEMLSRVD